MEFSPELKNHYTRDNMRASHAQRLAQFIAFGPVIFQTARIMIKFGILDLLRESHNGLTVEEIAKEKNLSLYAVKCLLEASLSIGLVRLEPRSGLFALTKTGWFLLTDPSTRVNISFNHDVNYRGWFHLEEALVSGKPAGLSTLGDWPTIYEGLSSLPESVQDSWFGFDHFYSDNSFEQALKIVFGNKPRTLLDVGGNTGRWALRCVGYDSEVRVTVLDLPQQIEMMESHVNGKPGAERIQGLGINLLEESEKIVFPCSFDAVWMSQFLDCFSEKQVVDILTRIKSAMNADSRLYIMETLWDRQKFETSALCLTLTSLYFTANANGNSKMFNSDDLFRLIKEAGLAVESVYDNLGWGHSLVVCRLISENSEKIQNNEQTGH